MVALFQQKTLQVEGGQELGIDARTALLAFAISVKGMTHRRALLTSVEVLPRRR